MDRAPEDREVLGTAVGELDVDALALHAGVACVAREPTASVLASVRWEGSWLAPVRFADSERCEAAPCSEMGRDLGYALEMGPVHLDPVEPCDSDLTPNPYWDLCLDLGCASRCKPSVSIGNSEDRPEALSLPWSSTHVEVRASCPVGMEVVAAVAETSLVRPLASGAEVGHWVEAGVASGKAAFLRGVAQVEASWYPLEAAGFSFSSLRNNPK